MCSSDLASRGVADSATESAQLLTRWSARRQSCKAVGYDLDGTVTIPARFYRDIVHPGEAFPPTPFTYRQGLKITLDFVKGRARRYEKGMIWQLDQRRFIPYCQIDLFDGHRFQTVRPRTENSDANWQPPLFDSELIEQGEKCRGRFFTEIDLPILFAHGAAMPSNRSLSPDRLLKPADRNDRSLRNPFARSRHEGASTLVFESEPPPSAPQNHEKIRLDLNRGESVISWSYCVDGKETASMSVKQKQTGRGWFPDGWTMVTWPESKNPQRTVQEITSVRITFDPPLDDAKFQTKATAGMIIHRLGENRRYVAGRQNVPDVPLDEYLRRREHSKAAN